MKKDAEVAWQAGDFGKPLMTHSGQPPEYRCYCGSVATIFENLEAGAPGVVTTDWTVTR